MNIPEGVWQAGPTIKQPSFICRSKEENKSFVFIPTRDSIPCQKRTIEVFTRDYPLEATSEIPRLQEESWTAFRALLDQSEFQKNQLFLIFQERVYSNTGGFDLRYEFFIHVLIRIETWNEFIST
jgi:hypothetical protein